MFSFGVFVLSVVCCVVLVARLLVSPPLQFSFPVGGVGWRVELPLMPCVAVVACWRV